MRERVSELVGGVSRVMWVMTFHSACARILRVDAERLGYKRAFTIYDEADSLRMIKRCMEELERRPQALPAARDQGARSPAAKNRLPSAEDYAQAQGSYFEETVAEVYELYERRMLAANAMDFDDLLVRTVNLLELFTDVRERTAARSAGCSSTSTRTPTASSTGCSQLLTRRAPQPLRRRRRRPERLRLPRRRHPQHPRLREGLPEDATVVKLEQNYRSTQDHPRRRQRGDRQQPRADARSTCGPRRAGASWSRSRSSSDEHEEARYVAGEIERLVRRGRARATRSRSSTGPTRRAGCSRTRSSASTCPTR